jgi:branched-chain amino acid transport system substrate-binding protein
MEQDTGGASLTKTVIWLVVLVLVVGGVVVYGKKGGTGEEKKVAEAPIKIGVMLPLTGDAASYGEPARNAYQMAVEEINNGGGISGQQLSLIIEDGKCNGKDGANAAQKLINVDQVKVIVGGICSSETLAAVPLAEAKQVVVFTPGATSPDLTGSSPYFFRNIPSDASQGKVLAEVANSKGWKKVAFLQEQTDYALGIYSAFTARFEELGGSVVKEEFPSNQVDFRSALTKMKGTSADVIFVDTQTAPVADKVLKQMQDLKWSPKIILNDVPGGDPQITSTYKNLLEGAFTAQFVADPNNPKFSKLLDAYKTKYGIDLAYASSYGATEYDAIYMLKDAITTVGYDGAKIAAWSRTVKDWDGASGKVTIKADGDRDGGHTAQIIKGGMVERLTQ